MNELNDHPMSWLGACVPLCALLTFMILLMLRSTGTIDTAWKLVFIPLEIGLAMWLCPPLWFYDIINRGDRIPACLGGVCVGGPLFAFAVLMSFFLDGEGPAFAVVLTPVWILNGFIFMAACAYSIDDKSCWAFGAWLVSAGLWLAFEINLVWMIDHRDTTSLSWPTTFIPVYIIEATLVIAGCAASKEFADNL